MENKSSMGWKAALIMGIYLLLAGLMCIFIPDFVLNAKFEGFTGQVWGEFASTESNLADLYRVDLREVGGFCFCIATLVIGVALNGYRKGEKWAWFTLLVAGIFCFSSPIYVGIVTGCWICLATGIVGFVLLAIAILPSAKIILAKG